MARVDTPNKGKKNKDSSSMLHDICCKEKVMCVEDASPSFMDVQKRRINIYKNQKYMLSFGRTNEWRCAHTASAFVRKKVATDTIIFSNAKPTHLWPFFPHQ